MVPSAFLRPCFLRAVASLLPRAGTDYYAVEHAGILMGSPSLAAAKLDLEQKVCCVQWPSHSSAESRDRRCSEREWPTHSG
jgi:hypothetical protein